MLDDPQLRVVVLARPADPPSAFLEMVGRHPSRYHVSVREAVSDVVALLGRGSTDAVVVPAAAAHDPQLLQRVREAATDAALVVLRDTPDDPVPLDPQDVGIQSTLEIWALEDQTLDLTLRLAVERSRLARSQALSARQAAQLAAISSPRDDLTGLPCGERLLEEVDRFLADAIRFRRPLTVALAELDDVDVSGQALDAGLADAHLLHTAGLMSQCLRTSDVLGRLDGRQLLVVMPGTAADAARQAVRRIQARLAEVPMHGVGLQLSVGMAALSGLMAVDELVFEADSALHTARAAGPSGLHVSTSAVGVG